MIYGGSASEAAERSRAVHVNGRDYILHGCVGTSPVRGIYVEGNEANDDGRPQGFLVHQPAGAVTLPHFHECDQFQVVVGGSGRVGKRQARPLTVQYANAHTPYGPIIADDDGIQYFTLRARWDPGAKYMPESRDKLVKGNQRTRLVGDIDGSESRSVIEPEADGLAARLLCLEPGERGSAGDPAGSGGQYIIVADGDMVRGEEALERLSCLFVTADEPAFTFQAGDAGLALLVLQLPRSSMPG